jgi:hypothetical protein
MTINKNKKALIVNLFGGPSVGKSTTAAGVFSLLKLHDVECELITEYAKDLVWEERHKTFFDQQYIFAKQNHRLWRVHDKVDIVVTDCPLMLSPIYGQRYGTTNESFSNNVVDVVGSYNNFNVLLTRTKRYNQNGRNETEDEAKEVDAAIKETLTKYNMKWREVAGNFEGINEIVRIVLKKKQRFKISL